MTAPDIDARQAQQPATLRLMNRLIVLIAMGLLVTTLALAVSVFAVVEINRLLESQQRVECQSVLLGDFGAAVGRAFDSPPAPNTARGAAALDIARSSARLHHASTVCADGVPAPLIPAASVPPTTTSKG